MFSALVSRKIETGLHFWGTLDQHILPNIAYPDRHIWEPSLELMKQNILTAQKHGFSYVNIHIGNAALETFNLDTQELLLVDGSQVDPKDAKRTFFKNVEGLHAFALDHGTRLIVESVPPCDAPHHTPDSRLHPHPSYALSNKVLEEAATELGIFVNNDLCHTASEFITDDRNALWEYLLERTQALAPYVKLMHANTMVEPFNGTDSHDGITDADFSHNVFPSKSQVEILFALFKNRDDVWIVNEPKDQHVENYNALLQFRDRMKLL